MSADPARGGEDEGRVEALLRVNAELAAEIRNLALGRAAEPRPGVAPAARRLSKLLEERDSLLAQLEARGHEIEALKGQVAELGRHNEAQARDVEALGAELARLRGGFAGVLRRARGRLRRR